MRRGESKSSYSFYDRNAETAASHLPLAKSSNNSKMKDRIRKNVILYLNHASYEVMLSMESNVSSQRNEKAGIYLSAPSVARWQIKDRELVSEKSPGLTFIWIRISICLSK